MKALVCALAFLALLFLVNCVLSKFKVPKVGAFALITGGVKTGKTCFAVNLAIKNYKKRLRATKFINFLRKIFRKELIEEPLLYSNIPLGFPHVLITKELLSRKVRPRYGSVLLLSEASLVADASTSKLQDEEFNENLMAFVKLIGHETKGGLLVCDTQSIADLNVNFKKNLSEYYYIHHLSSCFILPFVIAYVREDRFAYDGTSVSANYTEDVENSLKKVLIWKSTFDLYDTYCYSVLTDDLPVYDKVVDYNRQIVKFDRSLLKSNNIVSFKNYKFLNKEKKNNE